MQLNEVNSYADLEVYIKKEIARQTAEKIAVEIKLNQKWFKKLAKLISFCMLGKETKQMNEKRLQEDCNKFAIKINNVGVTVSIL